MSTTLAITLVGIVVIAAVGVVGRRGRIRDVTDWAVGGRTFGSVTMWFLQAGEIFTTFSFLGAAGLAFSGGVASLYSVAYVPIAYAGLYFLGPVVWRRARDRDHVTQADFLGEHFGSRGLATLVAVLGVVFLLPYLQLQITGLGLAVQIATGEKTSATLSMVVAFALVVVFVLWSGIRGVAATSYLKDVLMIVALAVVVVAVPVAATGGISATFARVLAERPAALTLHAGAFDSGYFVSSIVASAIGVLFLTLPHQWPALLSARSAAAVRRNYAYLPIYALAAGLPVIVGFSALVTLPGSTSSNSSLLVLASRTLPPWLLGVVIVATAATAMVPAAALIIGMSTMIARNVVRTSSARGQTRTNQLSVVLITGLALVLALTRPDLLANLLLLTYSGLDQLVPALAVAVVGTRVVGLRPVLAGLLVGEVVVVVLTFGPYHGTVNQGLIALVPNIVVVALGALWQRRAGRRSSEPAGVRVPSDA